MRVLQAIVLTTFLIFSFTAQSSAASSDARDIDDFYGEYVGVSKGIGGDALSERKINVAFKEIRRGFNISWTTMSHKKNGDMKRKTYSIDFRKTKRDNIYQSSMRKDVFGNRAPNDPMKGDPYVWARINGDTLSVYALIVTPDGSYDMQVYHRTLTPKGMQLSFSRFLEGEEVKTITADLTRVVK